MFLKDIREAVKSYLDNRVVVSISKIVPDVPVTLSPNEGFTFSVSARNAGSGDPDYTRLTNVNYHIWIEESDKAKLIVPPDTVGTSLARPGGLNLILVPGSEVSAYFLVPIGADLKVLDVGETDTITGLKGVAKAVGAFHIKCEIRADPDLDWIFPKGETSSVATRVKNIV